MQNKKPHWLRVFCFQLKYVPSQKIIVYEANPLFNPGTAAFFILFFKQKPKRINPENEDDDSNSVEHAHSFIIAAAMAVSHQNWAFSAL